MCVCMCESAMCVCVCVCESAMCVCVCVCRVCTFFASFGNYGNLDLLSECVIVHYNCCMCTGGLLLCVCHVCVCAMCVCVYACCVCVCVCMCESAMCA